MNTEWNDKPGPRDRQAICLLVTAEGAVHQFAGSDIAGVCKATKVAYRKDGKWSNTTYRITHHATTEVVTFREDFGTGRVFPQASWDDGYFWLAQKAPMLTREGFEAFVRGKYAATASRWDEAAEAEDEFGAPLTSDEQQAIRDAQARLAAEKAAAEKAAAEKLAASPFAALVGKVRVSS